MKRVKKIVVKYDDGTVATAALTLTNPRGLRRDELQTQMDKAVDQCVSALRDIPYTPTATYRNIVVQ